jgi:hypothetical protein
MAAGNDGFAAVGRLLASNATIEVHNIIISCSPTSRVAVAMAMIRETMSLLICDWCATAATARCEASIVCPEHALLSSYKVKGESHASFPGTLSTLLVPAWWNDWRWPAPAAQPAPSPDVFDPNANELVHLPRQVPTDWHCWLETTLLHHCSSQH